MKSSTLERRVDSAAKVAKLERELLFVDAEVKRIAALTEQEDELRKLQLAKQCALAEAEMQVPTKTEDGKSTISDPTENILPADVIDNKDLLNEYLITQASSVTGASRSTMETRVDLPPELPASDSKDESRFDLEDDARNC